MLFTMVVIDGIVCKFFMAFAMVFRPILYVRTIGFVVPAWGEFLEEGVVHGGGV